MGVPQIGIDTAVEQVADQLERTVAVAQVRPRVDTLAHAPARAGIGAQVHGRVRRLEPLGRVLGHERSGEQAEHMREMAVAIALAQGVAISVLVVRVLDVPLLDLAVRTDFDGRAQVVETVLPYGEHRLILAHQLAGLDGIVEELPHEHLLVGVRRRTRTLLGRVRRRRDVLAVLVLDERLAVQLGLFAQGGVDVVLQELEVAAVAVGIVGVLKDPGHSSGRPAPLEGPAGAGPAERGVLRMGHEALPLGVALGSLDREST